MDSDDAGPASTTDSGPNVTGEQFIVRLRDLEQRINELKEEIFRSKARLSLLAESILQNVIGGARAVVVHENQMGALYRLVRAVYALDGAPILTRSDDNGSLADQREFPVYNGQIGAGDHSLTVNLEYQGNGYGIFSYVKGYSFRVRSTQSFTIAEGKAIQIRVVGYEKGGPTTLPEERPAVRYLTRILSLRDLQDADSGEAATPAAAAPGAAAPAAAATTPAPAQGANP
ncbi:MAG: dihydrolipoamide acetyltransferase [Deltaproteobacteria bacterium]|nr:dihydrolipoamide acetyltransferase [Deltaproteobacteria bacterium]